MSQQGNQQPQSATGSGSNVLVAVRVRPLHTAEISGGAKSCIQVFDQRVVAIKKNGDAGQYLKSQQLCINEYEYDVVFDEKATQQEIYEKTAKSYIPKLINGQNVTVFAYGATGAGKTHTMLGDTRIEEVNLSNKSSIAGHNGIIPNAVKDVFRLISAKISRNLSNQSKALANEQYSVFVTFLEVYNEQVYDLLEPSGKVLAVREDQEKGIVVVAGVTEQPVGTYPEVIDLIIQGNKQRKTESTMANALSSRSHAVLQLLIKKTTKLDNGKEVLTESKLSLIDLAGSERASATNNRGLRLQEGAKINQSLLALANCINALAENTAISNNNVSSSSSSVLSTIPSANSAKPLKNVKFRDSKLTHLLKSSLEGNCHLIMIANINPSDQTYEDSHNTLKYANRAKNIKVNPLIQQKETKEVNWIERESQLRQENGELKQIIQKLQIQVESLQAFQRYVLTYKRIPGSEEAVGHDQQQQQNMKENFILNKSIESHSVSVKTSLPIYQDYNLHDISSEIQESVNEVLSYSTLPMLESINPQRASDTFLFDTSLSSLSTAQDLISDYLSTSQEGGRSSTSSALEDRRLSANNEVRRHSASYSPEKIMKKEVEKEEEIIEEFEFDIVNDVNQMIKMFENHDESTTVLEKRTASENQVKVEQQEQGDDEKEEEIMIVNNLTQKRRKINETRRKSIAITRRKSFIPTFASSKLVDNEEEEENHKMEVDDTPAPLPSTTLPVESAPVITENDDVMLTMDILPKASEEPVLSNNNTKKRRASNLPTASLSVQTRSMRRQSMSGATMTPAATPSTEFVKQKKVEPATTAVTINNTANDENNIPPTNKRSSISKRETPTNTPSTSSITTRRGVLTDSNIAKTSSSSLNITKSTSVAGDKSSISKFPVSKDITADKENQENLINKEFSSVNIEKPKPLEFDDFQIDWLGTSVAVSTAMPPPPSPTRRETRRMKMANRQSSLAKVTAMLDSVAQNVNNLATSFAVPPPANDTDLAEETPMPMPTVGTRRKTISMR